MYIDMYVNRSIHGDLSTIYEWVAPSTGSVLGALPQDGDTFEAHETSGFTW